MKFRGKKSQAGSSDHKIALWKVLAAFILYKKKPNKQIDLHDTDILVLLLF